MSVCESSVCSHLLRDETMNCVNNCTSPVCYADVYGREPLEDGVVFGVVHAANSFIVNWRRRN